MNIPALKAFAPKVRRQLIDAVTLQLDHALTARTPDYLDTYAHQVAELHTLAAADKTGLVERVAYTWFNRLAALRFLDARGWHPFGQRVLTPATPAETQPQLLKLIRSGTCPAELERYLNLPRIHALLEGTIPAKDPQNPQGEVYRLLVLGVCHFYHALLPDIFERLDDETELLLPDDLLTSHSIAHGFRSEISDDDCSEVEILGWLYQFYISEKKDQVMARKSAVPTEDIPAVTQLFTPHWIVRYLVENSLGRLWLLNHPDSLLRAWMPYYIEGEAETDFLRVSTPEEIKICDPAVGSGHMLTYAFDLLYVIYEEQGYAPGEIPALILRHNLYGLDICPRAAQLAELALVFKAREKSASFFRPGNLIRPNILALQDVHFTVDELRGYREALLLGDLFDAPMLKLLHQFEEATTFGSLIQPCLDEQQIAFARGFIAQKDLGNHLFLHETHKKVLRVLEQAEMLTQRYQVVVANPPYMGGKTMNHALRDFSRISYSDAATDLFAMFMRRMPQLAVSSGYSGCIAMHSWMFISSFARFRQKLFASTTVSSLLHLGPRAFDSISGEVVQTCAYVAMNRSNPQMVGFYFDLQDGRSEAEKCEKFLDLLQEGGKGQFQMKMADVRVIPGWPLAYWTTPTIRESFLSSENLGQIADPKVGMASSDNNRFLRLWHEVNRDKIGLAFEDANSAAKSGLKWFPYNKGGTFRRWYGNNNYVINWMNDGYDVKEAVVNNPRDPNTTHWSRRIFNTDSFFKPALTWSLVSSSDLSVRLCWSGFLFDVGGSSAFPPAKDALLVLGLLNSALSKMYLKIFNPTLNFQPGNIGSIPANRRRLSQIQGDVEPLVDEAVTTSKADWDNSETSWDFSEHPILRPILKGADIASSWVNWAAECKNATERMQELETENNRLFIEAYGLQDELSPEVPEEQITLTRADARKDMAAFLSYAVGCMMGRYSLDKPGLILADAGDGIPQYLEKVGLSRDQLTFAPDENGIIPVLDGDWFEDDIVARTRDFLRATFGEETLRENIRFLEESLGRELRSYYLSEFYKDHLQTYKKRPIYWMIQSPKKGFSVLIYLHRYTRDTLNLVLNHYLREFLVKLRSRIATLVNVQASSTASTRDKTAARKEHDKLTRTLTECEDWERQVLLPLAQARIELDLDDGVKVNYLKLGEALAPIPGLAAAED